MDNNFPTEFDLIIIGTGLVESIVSAAASRIGKRVLQVDTNDFYGGTWASFNLKTIQEQIKQLAERHTGKDPSTLQIGNDIFQIKDFSETWYAVDPAEPLGEVLPVNDQNPFSKGSLLTNSRKFNIDLVPKLHFARGKFVQLLVSSNIARYVEYRSVDRILTWANDALELVPCSRFDVFANDRVSALEKRMLMKLLMSISEGQYEGNQEETFLEFLRGQNLTPNLVHFIQYAIAQKGDAVSCSEGMMATRRFMASVGRFGKTPFLFSMYGSGETTQAFCRLSAVFGGIFGLARESVSLGREDGRIGKLFCEGQEIKGEHFLLGVGKVPQCYVKDRKVDGYISRAVLITSSSLMTNVQKHLCTTLLMYPPENGKQLVTVLELGSFTGTCPSDLFLVHFTAQQTTTPQEDFKHVIEKLFRRNDHPDDEDEAARKPEILWCCYFSIPRTDSVDLEGTLPPNLFVAPGPDTDLDYDESIEKAKSIFHRMYPDTEFLPRAPDPEEIVYGAQEAQEGTEVAFEAI